ncbi:hypothetical protein IZ6_01150 [Terrihabitans soli]|uniref:Uncharacterized protein n=1 Tax=Terrihabitans soli TaxID=708113 RepID=A0A6S6QR65_9HYPH|nr:hypothetical protein [Terrihabitans soli]BCJ89380.1 hypothetical protein IZ6_01150 [Terrihabitans soli]
MRDDAREMVIARLFDAGRTEVFEAWLQHLPAWLGEAPVLQTIPPELAVFTHMPVEASGDYVTVIARFEEKDGQTLYTSRARRWR